MRLAQEAGSLAHVRGLEQGRLCDHQGPHAASMHRCRPNCWGRELRHIKGFQSKAEIDEWLHGSRRIDWLRSQGYAK
jgi:hypothetical protein